MNKPEWWNWQTRTTQNRVPQGVWVQVPPWARIVWQYEVREEKVNLGTHGLPITLIFPSIATRVRHPEHDDKLLP